MIWRTIPKAWPCGNFLVETGAPRGRPAVRIRDEGVGKGEPEPRDLWLQMAQPVRRTRRVGVVYLGAVTKPCWLLRRWMGIWEGEGGRGCGLPNLPCGLPTKPAYFTSKLVSMTNPHGQEEVTADKESPNGTKHHAQSEEGPRNFQRAESNKASPVRPPHTHTYTPV